MYSHAQNANACRRREPLIVPPFLCRLWLSPSFLLSCSSLLLRSSYRFIFSSLFPSFNILSLLKGSISRAQPGPLKPPSQRCSVLSPSQSLSLSFFFFSLLLFICLAYIHFQTLFTGIYAGFSLGDLYYLQNRICDDTPNSTARATAHDFFYLNPTLLFQENFGRYMCELPIRFIFNIVILSSCGGTPPA